jgi:hypothetical protein
LPFTNDAVIAPGSIQKLAQGVALSGRPPHCARHDDR